MIVYKYKTVLIKISYKEEDDSASIIEKWLNDLGSKGWLLIGKIESDRYGNGGEEHSARFVKMEQE